jgi:hypothetical protein
MLQIILNSYEKDMMALHLSRTSRLVASAELPTRARRVPKSLKDTSEIALK